MKFIAQTLQFSVRFRFPADDNEARNRHHHRHRTSPTLEQIKLADVCKRQVNVAAICNCHFSPIFFNSQHICWFSFSARIYFGVFLLIAQWIWWQNFFVTPKRRRSVKRSGSKCCQASEKTKSRADVVPWSFQVRYFPLSLALAIAHRCCSCCCAGFQKECGVSD